MKTKTDYLIKFRTDLSELLKGKLNEENSKFPFDMNVEKDIQDLIKNSKQAIFELMMFNKNDVNKINHNYKFNKYLFIDKKMSYIFIGFIFGFLLNIIMDLFK